MRHHTMTARKTNHLRRGVILLVVLGMLGLFMLIIVSFIMTSAASRKGARLASQAEQTGMSPDALIKMAMYQLVRGPRNPRSAIGPHSLLEDLYGDKETIVGFIAASTSVLPGMNQQVIELKGGMGNFGPDRQPGNAGMDDDGNGFVDDNLEFLGSGSDDLLLQDNSQGKNGPPKVEGYFAGRVLTMLDGPYANQSTRIVRWFDSGTATGWHMYIRPFPFSQVGVLPRVGDRFVINGRPFNGPGVNSFAAPTAELATLPSPADQDEPYDAPDHLNPFMAARLYNTSSGLWEVTMPSFHRPDLVNYQKAKLGSLTTAMKRRLILRPDADDNSTVTDYSANPSFDPTSTSGPWDVDNDSDGIKESVWLDLGAPLQQLEDGRLVRPMFAIHCIDLDGRINLNAHGNPVHYTTSASAIGYGMGCGPAEINIGPIFEGAASQQLISMQQLMEGRAVAVTYNNDATAGAGGMNPVHNPARRPYVYPGRYGEVNLMNYVNMTLSASWGQSRPRAGLTARGTIAVSGGPLPIDPRTGDDNWPPAVAGTVRYDDWDDMSNLVRQNFPATHSTLSNLIAPINPTNLSAYDKATRLGNFDNPAYDVIKNAVPAKPADLAQARAQVAAQLLNLRGDGFTSPGYGSPIDLRGITTVQPGDLLHPKYLNLNFQRVASRFLPNVDTYAKTPSVWQNWVAATTTTQASIEPWWYYPTPVVWNEFIDDPYEINLFEDAQRQTFDYNRDGWPGDRPGFPNSPSGATTAITNISLPTSPGFFNYGNNDRRYNTVDIDAPLTPYELEQILRSNDYDRVLDDTARVKKILNLDQLSDPASFRNRVTTESWDLPVPSYVPTPEIFAGLKTLSLSGAELAMTDLLLGKVAAVFVLRGGSVSSTTWTAINNAVEKMTSPSANLRTRVLSPDLLLGLRMDINRPFGNNRDDNWDGNMRTAASVASNRRFTVDEPGEGAAQPLWSDMEGGSGSGGYTYSEVPNTNPKLFTKSASGGMDSNWDGGLPTHNDLSRQEYAKHLYVLMMMQMDSMYRVPTTPTSSLSTLSDREKQTLTAFRVAQWAINVADFRDRDSIMSSFEFDIFPFDDDDSVTGPLDNGAWDIDGDLSTNENTSATGFPYRGVVWGMENPELLITETFATHDKRIADTNEAYIDAMMNPDYKTTDLVNKDNDWDQVRLPEGSLFIELYCTGRPRSDPQAGVNDGSAAAGGVRGPRPPTDPRLEFLPPELYNTTQQIPGGGVIIPSTENYGFPVPAAQAADGLNQSYGALDLGRFSLGGRGKNPVWRIAVSAPHLGKDGLVAGYQKPTVSEIVYDSASPSSSTYFRPDTTTLQPGYMDLLNDVQPTPDPAKNVPIERVIWFANIHPKIGPDLNNPNANWGVQPKDSEGIPIFHGLWAPNSILEQTQSGVQKRIDIHDPDRQDPRLLLPPGQYAVIGPARPEATNTWTPGTIGLNSTVFAYTNHMNNPATTPVPQVTWTSPKISLDTANFSTAYGAAKYPLCVDINNQVPAGVDEQSIMRPLGIPIGRQVVDTSPTATNPPASAAHPFANFRSYPTLPIVEPAVGEMQGLNISEPISGYPLKYMATNNTLRNDATGTWQTLDTYAQPIDTIADEETGGGSLADLDMLQPGTYLDYRTLFLQRLANPLQEYDPILNPYITVDWMPVDLTIYNGETVYITKNMPITEEIQQGETDLGSWPPSGSTPRNYFRNDSDGDRFLRFETRQRGPNFASWPVSEPILWHAISTVPGIATRATASGASPNLPFTFKHNFRSTLGYLSSNYGSPKQGGTTAADITLGIPLLGKPPMGDPPNLFPWLMWNDRPFTNSMEMMFVPASSPGRFGVEFSYKIAGSSAPINFYENPNPPSYWGIWDAASQSSPNPIHHVTSPPAHNFPYGHLLNFFASSKANADFIDPAQASSNYYRIFDYVHVPSRFSGTEELLNPSTGGQPLYPFMAPFNRVSKYREPGRININTMFDKPSATMHPMWTAVSGFNDTGPFFSLTWDKILNWRGDSWFASHTDKLPAAFSRSFRSGSGGYVPTWTNPPGINFAGAPTSSPFFTVNEMMKDSSFPISNWFLQIDTTLLRRKVMDNPSSGPLFENDVVSTAMDRYPQLRFPELLKVNQSVTTRSNVFAAWVTMGFFEVERVTPSDIHPDGYQLYRELGIDTGKAKRHRGFCVINRSIPVGFLRGETLNVDKAFLIKHVIQ